MTTIKETSPSDSIATMSYDTALCIIPPIEKCRDVDSLRSLYDKGYGKWPPHINLIYPFVAPETLQRAKEQIQYALSDSLSATNAHLNVQLDQAGFFSHRANSTIILRETDHASPFRPLRSTALKALGHNSDTQYNPHLTIGQSEGQSLSSRNFLLSKAALLPSLDFEIQSLAILIRERGTGKDKSQSQMRLWGTIHLAEVHPSLSEYWLKSTSYEGAHSNLEEHDDNDDMIFNQPMETFFSREILPGTTYQFNPVYQNWTRNHVIGDDEPTPNILTISTYNVLIDSEFPPARDRDPLLIQTILSKSGAADILVLQEVSDDFLCFLLANADVQHKYPFTSHGPPNQPDIAPLPSLRNIVILSKWSFSWEFVPFHRRHKGAVVAVFKTFAKGSAAEQPPLVVAGVHLTCGLTDGSVAAKKVQLQNLKNHLTRNYANNPWIIAGDFNIPTSTYTIETALKNKSISQQTSRTVSSLETMMVEIGLLDAWSVARVEAMDHSVMSDADDLFEGEEGSTFNPRENELAAAVSGTSNNRPQRYDRILFRPQRLLRMNEFNHFGLPQIQGGVQVVPSDHSGVRASMKVLTEIPAKLIDEFDILQRYPVQPICGLANVLSTSALTSVLSAHEMFPTEEETQKWKEAYALIKEVILGSDNDEDASMADIPLVMVPVGSYAVGVWTSTSDIDCLCIGSISSKTFFKLARHRIFKAQDRGVRLMRKVEANTGTMFELTVGDVALDLQYCPAARIVERWSELPGLHHSDPIFNLPILSLRKLKPYRDLTYIQRTLPSISTFRLAYRCIKLWAVKRGIYSSKFGYIGGVHITLMLAWICKRLSHDVGSVTAADVVATFFHHYANFDWTNDMVFDAFFHQKKPRYLRSAREPMVVLGFHAPNTNVAHTSTVPGTHTLVKEFRSADRRVSEEGMTWENFYGNPVLLSRSGSSAGVSDFLRSHDSYVKVDIQYWGRTLSKGKGLVGWVESRCLNLVVDLNKALPNLELRIWPARFTATSPSSETDYHGCYLIGLSKTEAEPTNLSKEDKALAKQALQKSFDKFTSLLHGDERNYDPTTTWIGISLAKPSEVLSLRLDDREWGDYIPDLDEDSEDEDSEELDEPAPLTTRNLPIRAAAANTSTPVSTAKLRPASDVLHRLRWDPNLDPGDFIVGYEDRFLGAKETSLERWKTEQTDDEFIPQHRILYFKRRGDGEVVWERRTRVDRVFGSGVGAGEQGRVSECS
jgi:uncharacterized protein (UPF0248 family)/2'-5' RNA ligase